jgi:hypothetical protein
VETMRRAAASICILPLAAAVRVQLFQLHHASCMYNNANWTSDSGARRARARRRSWELVDRPVSAVKSERVRVC